MQAELYKKSSQCAFCKQKILRLEDAQVDHIKPYAQGGQTEAANAQLLHSSCNQRKGKRILTAAEKKFQQIHISNRYSGGIDSS